MELCSRCNKRVAVVFITKIENGKSSNEGLCLKCAKELGLPQVNDIINKLGLSDEDLDRMEMEVQGLVEASGAEDSDDDDGEPSSRTPPIDFQKLIGGSVWLRSDVEAYIAKYRQPRPPADEDEPG